MAYATIITNYIVTTTLEVYNEIPLVSKAHLSSTDGVFLDTAFGVGENTIPLAGSSLYVKPSSPNLNLRGTVIVGSSDSFLVERGSSVFVLNYHDDSAPIEQELRVLPEELKATQAYWGSGA